MGVVNNAHKLLLLQLGNMPLELLHFRPVHFGPEMMFRMIPVVEEEPVVNLPIAAHSPRNRLVGIGTVMAKVAVQITEAVSEVKKRQKEEKNIAPVEEEHDEQDGRERRQLDVSPHQLAIPAFAQLLAKGSRIIAKT